MKNYPLREEYTAYHEAGHVVSLLVNGEKFKHVTIIPDDNSNGHVHMKSQTMRRMVFFELLCCGGVAERLHAGASAEFLHFGISDDVQVMAGGLSEWKRKTGELFEVEDQWDMFVDMAEIVLGENWMLVCAVANALLKRKTLTYSECLAIKKRAGV